MRKLSFYSLLLWLTFMHSAYAADAGCPDAQVFSGKLISDICYDCILPLKIGGATISSGSVSPVPTGASSRAFCSCKDDVGVPQPGFMMSFWNPSFMVETVRSSGCSPILGGSRLPLADTGRQGRLFESDIAGSPGSGNDPQHMQYHYYSFPLLKMMDLFSGVESCDRSLLSKFDAMYFSELDPSHASEMLSFFLFPEAAIYARPDAVLACAADSVTATATGQGLDSLNWCAWGSLYNISGNVKEAHSWNVVTNKTAVRSIAAQHRRGLARLTVGDSASCGGSIYPTLPKSQYRLSYYYPVSEASSNHAISEHEYLWGSGKMIPGTGEDAVMLVWKWNDCCQVF